MRQLATGEKFKYGSWIKEWLGFQLSHKEPASDQGQMPTNHYCWRCKTVVPMLDEAEWAQISPLLSEMIGQIQQHRNDTGASLEQALRRKWGFAVLAKHFELTGVAERDVDALRYHRLVDHGPPCIKCGRLLRTKRAKVCAECGAAVTQ